MGSSVLSFNKKGLYNIKYFKDFKARKLQRNAFFYCFFITIFHYSLVNLINIFPSFTPTESSITVNVIFFKKIKLNRKVMRKNLYFKLE